MMPAMRTIVLLVLVAAVQAWPAADRAAGERAGRVGARLADDGGDDDEVDLLVARVMAEYRAADAAGLVAEHDAADEDDDEFDLLLSLADGDDEAEDAEEDADADDVDEDANGEQAAAADDDDGADAANEDGSSAVRDTLQDSEDEALAAAAAQSGADATQKQLLRAHLADGQVAVAVGAGTTSSCSKRETSPHCCDPNKYRFRWQRMSNGQCSFSGWHGKTYKTKPFASAVERNGRWYENTKSNRYYAGYGKWKTETPPPHPTNPTMERRARVWYRKASWPSAWYLAPNQRWYLSKGSSTYYSNGKWIEEKVKQHPTNPRLAWVAGAWRTKSEASQPGWRKFTLRNNRWYRAPLGNGPHSYQYWHNGKFVEEASFAQYKNNPYYRSVNGGAFKRFVPTKAETAEQRNWVKKRGRVYKSYWSTMYFENLKWKAEDPRWRAPGWRKNRGGDWVRRRAAAGSKWTRGPGPVPAAGWLWYRTPAMRQYWWYGKWKNAKLSPEQEARRARRVKMMRLASRTAPMNLNGIVNQTSQKYLERFLVWFLRDYLHATVQEPAQRPRINSIDVEPPTQAITPYAPEPAPFKVEERNGASQYMVPGEPRWEKTDLTKAEKQRMLSSLDMAVYQDVEAHRQRIENTPIASANDKDNFVTNPGLRRDLVHDKDLRRNREMRV